MKPTISLSHIHNGRRLFHWTDRGLVSVSQFSPPRKLGAETITVVRPLRGSRRIKSPALVGLE